MVSEQESPTPKRVRRRTWMGALAVLLLIASVLLVAFVLRERIRRFIENDSTAPTAPSGLVVTAGGTEAEPEFTLSWEPATDNIEVTDYLIFRDTDQAVATLDGDVLTFTDRLVEPEATHSYQVAALDDRGNPSPRTEPVKGQAIGAPGPDLQRPDQPDNLTAEVSGGRVILNWEASEDDVGVVRYQVFRNTELRVAEVEGDTTTVTETGVNDGTHIYQVAAFDAAGRYSLRSERVKVEVGTKQESVTRRGE